MHLERRVLLTVPLLWWACGSAPRSSDACHRLLGRYATCQLAASLDEAACVQRYGTPTATCQQSMSAWVSCIEATPCSRLADTSQGIPCKNEYVAADIDCDQ